MEGRLVFKETRETPAIEFDSTLGIFKIEGRSLSENSFEFYAPVITWLKAYIEKPNPHTNLEIFLEYLNSGSLKQFFRILYLLEDLVELGSDVQITWYYEANDELMLEKGREFQQLLSIPISLKVR